MKLGVALPFIDVAVGGNPAAIREFAQTAEEILAAARARIQQRGMPARPDRTEALAARPAPQQALTTPDATLSPNATLP